MISHAIMYIIIFLVFLSFITVVLGFAVCIFRLFAMLILEICSPFIFFARQMKRKKEAKKEVERHNRKVYRHYVEQDRGLDISFFESGGREDCLEEGIGGY